MRFLTKQNTAQNSISSSRLRRNLFMFFFCRRRFFDLKNTELFETFCLNDNLTVRVVFPVRQIKTHATRGDAHETMSSDLSPSRCDQIRNFWNSSCGNDMKALQLSVCLCALRHPHYTSNLR